MKRETMIRKDILVLREVIDKLVPLLAGQGLKVTQRGMQAKVSCDPRTFKPTVVNIPNVPDDASEDLILAIQGFIDHEVGHVLFSDFSIAVTLSDQPTLKSLTNIVEDPYVERRFGEKFPGSVLNIHRLHEFFAKKVTLPALAEAGKIKDERERLDTQFRILIVPLVRAWAGQKFFQEFIKDYMEHPLLKGFADAVPADVKARVSKVKNSSESVEIAQIFEEILKPPKKEEPPAPETPEEEEAEESEDGEGGKGSPSRAGEGEADEDAEPHELDKGDGDEDDAGDDADEHSSGSGDESEDSEGDHEDEDRKGDADRDDADTDEPVDEGEDETGAEGEEESDEDGSGARSEDEDYADSHVDSVEESEEESEDTTEGKDDHDDDEIDGGSSPETGEDSAAGSDESDADTTDADEVDEDGAPSPFTDAPVDLTDDDTFEGALSERIAGDMVDAMRDSDYTIYTRDFDKIEPLQIKRWEDSWLTALDDQVGHMVGPMQKGIERMMAARSHVQKVPGYRSGKLHGAGLHKLAVKDDRIFRRRHEVKAVETAVTLLVDCSGSMRHCKIDVAMAAAYALSQTLDRVRVAHEVMGYTTYNDSRIVGAYEDIRADEKRMGRKYTRTEPIWMPIFKEFHERMTPPVRKRFAAAAKTMSLLQNIDGECIEVAANRLLRRSERRKVLIVLSDGSPACDSPYPHKIDQHAKDAIKKVEKLGVETIGIGIMTDDVTDYYPKNIVLHNLNQLPQTVMGELRKVLEAA